MIVRHGYIVKLIKGGLFISFDDDQIYEERGMPLILPTHDVEFKEGDRIRLTIKKENGDG